MSEINRAFAETFSLLFGESNLDLEDYRDYLLRFHYDRPGRAKSDISGKEVSLCTDRYEPASKFISLDEVDYSRKFQPLNLNQIKDLDSITEQLSDRFLYCGNKVFGNSSSVTSSDNCTDSHVVHGSHDIEASKFIAYSTYLRDSCEYCFGSTRNISSRYMIKGIGGAHNARVFESYLGTYNSDAYFCAFCHGCQDIMFSFNLRSKRHCIGNLELEKGKFLGIKKSLLAQMRQYLEKNRSFYSIFEAPAPSHELVNGIRMPKFSIQQGDMLPMEEAFGATCSLVLGKRLGSLDSCQEFLSRGVSEVKKMASPFGNEFYYSDYFWNAYAPRERMVSFEEAAQLAVLHIDSVDEKTTLKQLLEKISGIAFYNSEYHEGPNHNNIQTPISHHGTDAYRVCSNTYTKNSAYCVHPTRCEAMFGCSTLLIKCQFCIRCYNSSALTSCFEVDGSSMCSNCYFCHNIENCSDCMFCFNAKNLKYAVGNTEFPKADYLRIKKLVLAEIGGKLEKDKKLDISIFNIALRGGKK